MSIDESWLRAQFPDVRGVNLLGAGGQKHVYSGGHSAYGPIVLKIFHPHADPHRAEREIQAVRDIRSHAVPRVHEYGTVDSDLGTVIWLYEEHLPGVPLRQLIGTPTLTHARLLSIFRDLVDCLCEAEFARIVHRDVKPENILVGDKQSWLLDFGIARHVEKESLTATRSAHGVGTPGYAPPEQFRNRKPEIDSRTDIYALGVTIYECAEGRNPFIAGARDILEVVRRMETQELPRLAADLAGAPGSADLIMSMTRRRRDQRPASMSECQSWLAELLGDI